jgi:hypothetical protein
LVREIILKGNGQFCILIERYHLAVVSVMGAKVPQQFIIELGGGKTMIILMGIVSIID